MFIAKRVLYRFISLNRLQIILVLLPLFLLMLVLQLAINSDNSDSAISEVHDDQDDDFNWLRSKNYLRNFVQPDRETALLLPRNFSSEKVRDLLVCFVMSSPTNFVQRMAIRETWGADLKPLFVIAKHYSLANETVRLVSAESELYDDIILEDFIDVYMNLTVKTAFAMKHFLKYFRHSKYFLKTDDDAYLNVEELYRLIAKSPSDSLIGKVNLHFKPSRTRNNRCFVPPFLYDSDEFPTYLIGLCYVIPGNVTIHKI